MHGAMPERLCPKCGSSKVAYVVYGLPVWSPWLERADREGRLIMGGCCMTGDDPDSQCLSCGHRWTVGREPRGDRR